MHALFGMKLAMMSIFKLPTLNKNSKRFFVISAFSQTIHYPSSTSSLDRVDFLSLSIWLVLMHVHTTWVWVAWPFPLAAMLELQMLLKNKYFCRNFSSVVHILIECWAVNFTFIFQQMLIKEVKYCKEEFKGEKFNVFKD